jgi:hypothetical protein
MPGDNVGKRDQEEQHINKIGAMWGVAAVTWMHDDDDTDPEEDIPLSALVANLARRSQGTLKTTDGKDPSSTDTRSTSGRTRNRPKRFLHIRIHITTQSSPVQFIESSPVSSLLSSLVSCLASSPVYSFLASPVFRSLV